MKTNEEFNNLMKLDKHILLNSLILPGMNEEICIPVGAINSKETFSLDICRKNTIVLSRKKLQERLIPNNDLMIRLEIDGRPHINPDGKKLSRNHMHIFKEGYGMSWAYELNEIDAILFKNTNDFTTIFFDFCKYCNISINGSNIQGVI